MTNYFKRNERKAFIVLLGATVTAFLLGFYCLLTNWSNGGKLLATSGLLSTIAGLVQLEISGLFKRIFDEYNDEKKYPYGPPSYITREIIDNPDTPIRTSIRNYVYFNTSTGFWLIVFGTLVQIAATWA